MLMTAVFLKPHFEQALPYEAFVDLAQREGHREQWDQRYSQLELTAAQSALVRSFTRRMHVLCLTGTWCGDCALQGASFARIAQANPKCIDLRFLQRTDDLAELIAPNTINGGFRVPLTWFMAEDFEPLHRMGDRTLSRYRSMARKALGERSNVVAPPPADPVREVLQEALDEVERVHLLLRLSARLREQHGD